MLDDKVMLITGSAKRLGREVALYMAERGAHIIVHYHTSEEAARQTVATIQAAGGQAWAFGADLSQPEAITRLFEWIEREIGRLDVVINNASSFRKGDFMDLTVDEWDWTMAVNLRAPFLTTQQAARLMAPGGVIVNYGDMMGAAPDSSFPDHSVSKSALLMLTKVAAKALGTRGIRVNAIVPGPVYKSEHIDEARWQAIGTKLPLGRPGQALNVAQATEAVIVNDFMTGAVLHVDGGDALLSMEDVLA